MKAKLTKLVNVKSLVTLALTVVFSYLAVANKINAEQFLTIFTMIMAFYFGTQATKKTEEK